MDFLKKVIQPNRPDFLIFNVCSFSFPIIRSNKEYLAKFVGIAKNSSHHFIWKTTTAKSDAKFQHPDNPIFMQQLRDLNVTIYDAYTYTKDVSKVAATGSPSLLEQICWDTFSHFTYFVYRDLNKALLYTLTSIIVN